MFYKKLFGVIILLTLILFVSYLKAEAYSLEEIQTIVSEIEQAHTNDNLELSEQIKAALPENIKNKTNELNESMIDNHPGINPNWQDIQGCRGFSLGGLADRYTTLGKSKNEQEYNNPQLIIFISSSLANKTIKNLYNQAAKAKGNLVIKGFVNNDQIATWKKRNEIFGKNAGSFNIDPESFETFSISRVPAFVVSNGEKTCSGDECTVPAFDVVYGDLSLEAALNKIINLGSAKTKPIAKMYLEKLTAA